MKTDLHSAFDQVKGNNSCVCGATAQNPTKATQDKILLRAELTAVSLWRNTGKTLESGQLRFLKITSVLDKFNKRCLCIQPSHTSEQVQPILGRYITLMTYFISRDDSNQILVEVHYQLYSLKIKPCNTYMVNLLHTTKKFLAPAKQINNSKKKSHP